MVTKLEREILGTAIDDGDVGGVIEHLADSVNLSPGEIAQLLAIAIRNRAEKWESDAAIVEASVKGEPGYKDGAAFEKRRARNLRGLAGKFEELGKS